MVTNTGDTYLSGFEVPLTTELPGGGTASATATSEATGPLAPGDRRTFAVDAQAGTGQFRTDATITAVAVNAHRERLPQQPAAASGSSWFFAGASGLSVTKLLDDVDVTSQPGPSVGAGDPVRWSYVVTNTGTLTLTDVAVTDLDTSPADAASAPVHSGGVPSLAPGESVTLEAEGTAREGYYSNTVTVTAPDPERPGAELSASDESWYTGGAGVLAVTKQVRVEGGTFAAAADAEEGEALEWEIVVTNDGATRLTDVVARDGDIEATARNEDLEPGESATFLFTGTAVESLVNTVEVEAADPLGTAVSASASAEVTVGPATEEAEAAEDEAEPEETGAGSALLWWILGGLVVVGGVVAWVIVRRRRAGLSQEDAEPEERPDPSGEEPPPPS